MYPAEFWIKTGCSIFLWQEKKMAKNNVESLLIAGGEDKDMRARYDALKTKEDFLAMAAADGFDFTVEEFDSVLNESGDSFDLIGNPPKRQIWWK